MNTRASTITIAAAGLLLCAAATLVDPTPATAAADPPQRVTGTLLSVERLPNHPGAKCGHHFDLTVAVASGGRQVVQVYDKGVREDELVALRGQRIEIDLVAGGIVQSVRAARRGAGRAGALADLSTIKYC